MILFIYRRENITGYYRVVAMMLTLVIFFLFSKKATQTFSLLLKCPFTSVGALYLRR